MRSLIRVTALASLLSSCSEAALECSAILDPPVKVELINAETGRRISGAHVTVTDGNLTTELMEIARGQYAIWSDAPGDAITATHADYFEASGILQPAQTECSLTRTVQIGMDRKAPCNQGVAGVRLAISDVADGAPIAGAVVQLSDGIYSEEMLEMGPGLYEGAYDRPGIYAIEARAQGYLDAAAGSVWVAEDDCSVLTSSVSLKLRRALR